MGVKGKATDTVNAQAVEDTKARTIHGFRGNCANQEVMIYTD